VGARRVAASAARKTSCEPGGRLGTTFRLVFHHRPEESGGGDVERRKWLEEERALITGDLLHTGRAAKGKKNNRFIMTGPPRLRQREGGKRGRKKAPRGVELYIKLRRVCIPTSGRTGSLALGDL